MQDSKKEEEEEKKETSDLKTVHVSTPCM